MGGGEGRGGEDGEGRGGIALLQPRGFEAVLWFRDSCSRIRTSKSFKP